MGEAFRLSDGPDATHARRLQIAPLQARAVPSGRGG